MHQVNEVNAQYLVDANVGTVVHAVPPGYKLTEVGVIPEDWEVSTVGSEFYMQLGKMLDENKNTGDLKVLLGNRGVQWGRIDVSDLGSVRLSASELGKYRLKVGDILVCEGGEVGRCSIWNDELPECYFQKALHRLRPKGIYSPVLFLNVMQWLAQKGGLQNFVTQTSIAHLPKDKFELVPLPVPGSLHEQTAIANALSDVDALINSLEKLIAKKQAIKTATMQQLLTGKTRLPQFATHPDGTPKGYKQSELGEIPEDWDVCSVGDKCDLLTGFPFPSEYYSNSGVRLLRGSNVKRNCTDWDESITQHWPEITPNIKLYELKVGDIVISMDGSLVGRSFAQLTSKDIPAVLLQRVARIRTEIIDVGYLKEWICSEFFTEHCDSVKTVTAIPHISPQDIKSFRLVLPSCRKEQSKIATTLSDMAAEVNVLEQRLTKTQQLKQGMMQELLTGKTRLVKPSGNAA